MHEYPNEFKTFKTQHLLHLDMNGPDLLHFAASVGHIKMVRFLIKEGISIDTIPKYVINHHKVDYREQPVLFAAIQGGHMECIKVIIKAWPSRKYYDKDKGRWQDLIQSHYMTNFIGYSKEETLIIGNAIACAVMYKRHEILRYLLETCPKWRKQVDLLFMESRD